MYKKKINPIKKQSSLTSKIEKSVWLQELKEEELELIQGGNSLQQQEQDQAFTSIPYSIWW